MDFKPFFQEAIERRASDVHLIVGAPPALRIDGELFLLSEELITQDLLMAFVKEILHENQMETFMKERELDFGYDIFETRFRVNLHFQRNDVGISCRLIQTVIPRAQDLGFSEPMMNMPRLKDGLILVTGTTGSGKSTTLAAMLGLINENRRAHIITVEDPIEYIFQNDKAIIEQREVGSDTLSFGAALKYVLRQDPNVIMVGEMRDAETISAALTAAETGHLVLSTLHTNTAAEAVSRIIDAFPSHRRQQVLAQMSMALRAVIAQQLIPKIGGGRCVAREIMINNQAVANLIRENKISQLATVIKTNYQMGMIDMNRAVENLYNAGLIDKLNAERYSRNLETKAIYL